MNSYEKELEQIKKRLIIDQPFFATILLSLKIEITDDVPTAATNGKVIKINQEWFFEQNMSTKLFVLCHEVMHVAYEHMFRKEDRHPMLWNMACDYVINDHLYDQLHVLPDGVLYSDEFSGMSEEQVYRKLIEDQRNGGGGEGSDENKDIIGQDIDYSGVDKIPKEESERLKASIKALKKSAERMAGNLSQKISERLRESKPQVNWRELLHGSLQESLPDDYTWVIKDPRFSDVYIPGMFEESMNVYIAVDTSGSIDNITLSYFISECKSIVESLNAQGYTLFFDTDVEKVIPIDEVTNEREFIGGTNIEPVLKWAAEQERADALVVMTDGGFFDKPKTDPGIPVVWLVIDNEDFKPPFGEVVHVKGL